MLGVLPVAGNVVPRNGPYLHGKPKTDWRPLHRTNVVALLRSSPIVRTGSFPQPPPSSSDVQGFLIPSKKMLMGSEQELTRSKSNGDPLIFVGMDTKPRNKRRSRLSALVSSDNKRRLRQVSEKQDRSMTAVLDDLLSTLPETGPSPLKVGPGRGAQWLKANLGAYAGRLRPEDWQRDDRFGHLLRKHVKP
jgi:hypothetical protein